MLRHFFVAICQESKVFSILKWINFKILGFLSGEFDFCVMIFASEYDITTKTRRKRTGIKLLPVEIAYTRWEIEFYKILQNKQAKSEPKKVTNKASGIA